MQLESIQTFIVANPPPSFGGRYFVFVKLRTRCGIEGIGEAYTATFGPNVVAAMAEDLFARVFQGEDPMQTETLWRRAYGEGFSLRPDISLMGVLSALEMACWDITGKALEQPVYKLLGGLVNPRLRSYTYLYPDPDEDESFYGDPDRSAARAARYVEEGFTAVKFDPVGGYSVFDPRQPTLERMDMSERFCARIREAVGDKADLLFGTHGQFTVSGAKRLARRLEPYNPLWFEEPTPPERPESMAEVARYTCIPVATGERLCTKYEFARVLETGAASILQPNLGRVGGILEAKKIAGMAEAHYAQIAPHLYCGPVVAAANIQLAACIPNFLILESIQQFGGFHAALLKKPLQWEGGYVIPSKEPGLGVELNEAVALAHPYDSTRLHLDMAQHPLGYF
ncbi:MAG: mandelate racemase/muconate lactonizing enzyme family protein [Rhodoferax sp.]|uniref:mandelate racemase/muconate lactonizing enzyme family protein n=1 Tax=Rhodoferax sp. TaxID=50421 RepID=UPI003264B325